mmetsp:Transcript_41209/g.132471  ORF Transcript_41209/g.132471 Transcript_41209/m.132471 type:complete len:260 (-) Transcript_41209:75-854(-)
MPRVTMGYPSGPRESDPGSSTASCRRIWRSPCWYTSAHRGHVNGRDAVAAASSTSSAHTARGGYAIPTSRRSRVCQVVTSAILMQENIATLVSSQIWCPHGARHHHSSVSPTAPPSGAMAAPHGQHSLCAAMPFSSTKSMIDASAQRRSHRGPNIKADPSAGPDIGDSVSRLSRFEQVEYISTTMSSPTTQAARGPCGKYSCARSSTSRFERNSSACLATHADAAAPEGPSKSWRARPEIVVVSGTKMPRGRRRNSTAW